MVCGKGTLAVQAPSVGIINTIPHPWLSNELNEGPGTQTTAFCCLSCVSYGSTTGPSAMASRYAEPRARQPEPAVGPVLPGVVYPRILLS